MDATLTEQNIIVLYNLCLSFLFYDLCTVGKLNKILHAVEPLLLI